MPVVRPSDHQPDDGSQGTAGPRFWKTGGVYLITGGAGGLGLLFARSIARQAAGARLVLVGRGAPTAPIEERLRELEDLGAD